MVIFDMSLIQTARSQVRRTGFAEIRECYRFIHTSSVGSILHSCSKCIVTRSLWLGQFAPERCLRIITRMGSEPSLEKRNTRNKGNCPLPHLSLHSDLIPVFVVRDITDPESTKFTGAGPCIPPDRDKCCITRVSRGIESSATIASEDRTHSGSVCSPPFQYP